MKYNQIIQILLNCVASVGGEGFEMQKWLHLLSELFSQFSIRIYNMWEAEGLPLRLLSPLVLTGLIVVHPWCLSFLRSRGGHWALSKYALVGLQSHQPSTPLPTGRFSFIKISEWFDWIHLMFYYHHSI